MRPLTEEETKAVFEKLYKYIGKSIQEIIERDDEPYCLRLQKNRVYYVKYVLIPHPSPYFPTHTHPHTHTRPHTQTTHTIKQGVAHAPCYLRGP